MSATADTQRLPETSDRVARDGSGTPSTEPAVAARLVQGEGEPFPYTKIRDWIALLPQPELSDGAFRLYYISRSVIWENSKGGPPPRPVIEITYEEYALILGRSSRTISRFAEDLFATGLWEELVRESRSVRVPGRSRPQVQTVVTIRVHDFPQKPGTSSRPVKTWDVLGAIREAKRRAHREDCAGEAGVSAGQCDRSDLSAQSDQQESRVEALSAPAVSPGADRRDGVSAGQCDRSDLSAQSDQASADGGRGDPPREDQQEGHSPGRTQEPPGQCDRTDLSEPVTDLSEDGRVSPGQTTCDGALKKTGEEEKPSLPPTPSQPDRPAALADELAMFSEPTIELVTQLYETTLTTAGLQPLSPGERAGLARRIEGRLTEGWSLTRVRAVLTGGSLVGVKMPGRLWSGRLDDMPAYASIPGRRPSSAATTAPNGSSTRTAPAMPPRASPGSSGATEAARTAVRRERSVVVNDCSAMRDPNAGKTRYEVPDDRGIRMTVRWADTSRVLPWCGRCSSDSRCLRPPAPGSLLRACPDCHPAPHEFPPDTDDDDASSGAEGYESAGNAAAAGAREDAGDRGAGDDKPGAHPAERDGAEPTARDTRRRGAPNAPTRRTPVPREQGTAATTRRAVAG